MLVLLLALHAHAAEPCAKAKVTTDDAQVEHVVLKGSDWEVDHSPSGTTYSARMFRSGASGTTLDAGWPLYFRLDDGSAVRLHLAESAEPRSYTNETGSFTQWEASFKVESADVAKLAEANVASMKSDLGGGVSDAELGRGRSKKLRAAFECVASQATPAAATEDPA